MSLSLPTDSPVPERLVASRAAPDRHAWQEAFDGVELRGLSTPVRVATVAWS